MTYLLLLLFQLAAVPMPQPPPEPLVFQIAQVIDGPYAFREGWTCWRLDTDEKTQSAHCECLMACQRDDGREDPGCQTYCAPKIAGSPKCRCHGDESCEMPTVEAPK
jgi:hypothetical protein